MHRNEITECLSTLQDYLGHTLKPTVIKLYVDALSSLEDGILKSAMVNIIKEFKSTSAQPFPLIATILELVGQDGNTKAINAVTAVKRMSFKGQYVSVDFKDRTLHAIIDRFGGWQEVCLWTNKDWQLNERNFINAYKSALSAGVKGAKYCMGLLEEENRYNGYTPEKLKLQGRDLKPFGYIVEDDKELIPLEDKNRLSIGRMK